MPLSEPGRRLGLPNHYAALLLPAPTRARPFRTIGFRRDHRQRRTGGETGRATMEWRGATFKIFGQVPAER